MDWLDFIVFAFIAGLLFAGVSFGATILLLMFIESEKEKEDKHGKDS